MRPILMLAGLLGATAVALGAFGAHGLDALLADMGLPEDSIPRRLENFATAVRYQLHVAVAMLALAGLAGGPICGRGASLAAGLFTFGALVFCGLLYALVLLDSQWRWLGAVVPIGGLSLIGAWAVVAAEAVRARACRVDSAPESADTDLRAEVIRLEEAITHQQQTIQLLNESVTEARDALDDANRRANTLEQTVKRLVDMQQAAEDLPDERPPHY